MNFAPFRAVEVANSAGSGRERVARAMLLAGVTSACWQSSGGTLFQGAATADEQRQLAAFTQTLQLDRPRQAALLPRLRLLREVLGANDDQARAVLALEPRFWSQPIEKSLVPRHAYLASRCLPHGARLLRLGRCGLRTLLLKPKSDVQFASTVAMVRGCGASAAEVIRIQKSHEMMVLG